jgi:hypothetical protein
MFGCDCSTKRYPRVPKTKLFMARAAAKAVSLEETVFRFFMTISVGESSVSFNDGILGAILQVLTRYSANDPHFPVNDRSLFTGKTHVIGGASRNRAGRPTQNSAAHNGPIKA